MPRTAPDPAPGDAPDLPAEIRERPGAPVPIIPPAAVVGLGLVALGLTIAATGAPTGPATLALIGMVTAVTR